jgi:CHAT domain-containing protein
MWHGNGGTFSMTQRWLAARSWTAFYAVILCLGFISQVSAQTSSDVDRFIAKGNAALQQGQYADAQSDFKLALALLPPTHADQSRRGDVILLLAQALMTSSDLLAARDLLESSWPTLGQNPDPERVDRAHYFLMTIFMQSSDYVQAATHGKALVTRYTERLGPDNQLTLDGKLNLGSVLINLGEERQGLDLLDKAYDTLKMKGDLGLYHTRLNMVATSLEGTQKFGPAARYYQRLIDSLEQQPISQELGYSYFNMAVLKKSERKLEEALPYHEKALEVLNKTVGPDSIDTIAAVSGLGNTYALLGRTASGVQFLEQAFQHGRKIFGENNNEIWMYGNNYANALRDLDQFENARQIDQAAYDWRVKNLGPNDAATEISALNLGLDFMGLKKYDDADRLFRALYDSRLKRLGENNPATKDAAKFLVLSQSYNPKPGSVKKQAVEDIQKLDRLAANIQGGALDKLGKPKQAVLYHRRAFEASVTENGPVDPTTLLMLRNVALSEYEVGGRDGQALETYRDLNRRTLMWARTEIAATVGKARAEDIRRVANRTIYDIIRLAEENPKAHDLLFQVLMDWKGLGTTEQALLNQLRSKPPNPDVAKRVARLEELQKLLRTPGQSIDQIQSEIQFTEVKLAESSDAFRRSRADVSITPRQVVSRLKPGDALLDYFIGDRLMPNSTEVVQEVYAFVTLADGRAIVKFLAKLEDVKAIVNMPGFESETAQRRKLHQLLLKPLLGMPSLRKANHFYIVPDGELFLVPFEGLLDDKDQPFGQTADVTLMRSATGLMQPEVAPQKQASLLLVGQPDYGTADSPLGFSPLPMALKEVQDIDTIALSQKFKPTLVTQKDASEAAVRNAVGGQTIVHMATHGFFLQKDFNPSLEPPWRGGLALQGANSAVPDGTASDDGIVYAAELANWKFDATDLVVLSACETASGERSYVEGLRGIPAALAVSGAKHSLLALWTVPDEGTANFMTTFYRHLLSENMTYESAFRATKRDAMAGRIVGAEEPEAWQAFVMMRN